MASRISTEEVADDAIGRSAMKTMAIRLTDEVHAQLVIVAQLDGTTVAEELRQAIEAHLAAKTHLPFSGVQSRAAQCRAPTVDARC